MSHAPDTRRLRRSLAAVESRYLRDLGPRGRRASQAPPCDAIEGQRECVMPTNLVERLAWVTIAPGRARPTNRPDWLG